MAKIALSVKDHAQAIAYWERLLEVDPDSVNARYNLGLAELDRQDFDAAIGHWKAVLEADPAREDARENLAKAYLVTGQREAAVLEVAELRRRGAFIDPTLEAALESNPPAPPEQ
jgi:tetratricopeptide (TPR) repeat protein